MREGEGGHNAAPSARGHRAGEKSPVAPRLSDRSQERIYPKTFATANYSTEIIIFK